MKQFRQFEKRMGGLRASRVFLVALFTLPATLVFATHQSQPPAPDVIFIGQFLTLDPGHPQAEAIAVSGGRIVAVGSKSEVEALANKATRKISIPGVVLPGFADAHIHTEAIGQQLELLNLQGLNKAEVLAKVAEAVHSAPQGGWIFGEGWDEGFWQPAVFPTAKELDAVSGNHPVVLYRIDMHSAWVNSKVLALAKISRDTPDSPGGLIRRNAAGEPTGMLVDHVPELISITPKPTVADRVRHIRAALEQFTRWGLTSVHDAAVDLETIAIYKDLLKRGELPVRVYAMVYGDAARTHYLASGPEPDLGGGMLAVRSFKLILDGALGSRGAEMTEAYSDPRVPFCRGRAPGAGARGEHRCRKPHQGAAGSQANQVLGTALDLDCCGPCRSAGHRRAQALVAASTGARPRCWSFPPTRTRNMVPPWP